MLPDVVRRPLGCYCCCCQPRAIAKTYLQPVCTRCRAVAAVYYDQVPSSRWDATLEVGRPVCLIVIQRFPREGGGRCRRRKRRKRKRKREKEREREKDYGSSRLSADNVYSGPRELLLRLVSWSATSGESASLDVPQRRRRGKKPTKTNSPALSLSFSLSLSLFLAVFFLLGKLSAGL